MKISPAQNDLTPENTPHQAPLSSNQQSNGSASLRLVKMVPEFRPDGQEDIRTINLGESAIVKVSHVSITAYDNKVRVDFNYQIYNDLHPGEIDQIFVAIGRKVMACVYNGIPGRSPGHSERAYSVFSVDTPCINQSIYIARIPGRDEGEGKAAYENGSNDSIWVGEISQ